MEECGRGGLGRDEVGMRGSKRRMWRRSRRRREKLMIDESCVGGGDGDDDPRGVIDRVCCGDVLLLSWRQGIVMQTGRIVVCMLFLPPWAILETS